MEDPGKYAVNDRLIQVRTVLEALEACPDTTDQSSVSLSPMCRVQLEVVAMYHRQKPGALHRQLLEEVVRNPGFRSLLKEATEGLKRELGAETHGGKPI